MLSTREEALAALGLSATPEADAAAIQRAFERLARRYPEAHFPERFRALLEARDWLMDPGRVWRERIESRTLDLAWALPHLLAEPRAETRESGREAPVPSSGAATPEDGTEALRRLVQNMLREGYRAESLVLGPEAEIGLDDGF